MAPTSIPIVDLSAFFDSSSTPADKEAAASALLSAGRRNGFVGLRGHGFPRDVLAEAFALNKSLFDLPHEKKLQAPHPKASRPHRGYSAPGNEQAFSKDDLDKAAQEGEKKALVGTNDLKESFEVGDDANDYDTNIWLPEDALPGFRSASTALFDRFRTLSYVLLDALMLSLQFTEDEKAEVKGWHKPPAGQLRFLHYLPVPHDQLQTDEKARLPAHTDWNSITLSFQDSVGGLEYQDRASGDFVNATTEQGLLYLNIGDIFERISNGNYAPGIHRVVLPKTPPTANGHTNEEAGRDSASQQSVPDRYSIIFFLPVGEQAVVAPPASRVQADGGNAKFEPVKFLDYTEAKAKWHFEQYSK